MSSGTTDLPLCPDCTRLKADIERLREQLRQASEREQAWQEKEMLYRRGVLTPEPLHSEEKRRKAGD